MRQSKMIFKCIAVFLALCMTLFFKIVERDFTSAAVPLTGEESNAGTTGMQDNLAIVLSARTIEGWHAVGARIDFAPTQYLMGDPYPWFSFRQWQSAQIGSAPAPSVGFGLRLNNTKVTDADLLDLRKFAQLKALDLTGTEVTDAGIKSLAALPNLEYLRLGQTNVSEKALAFLTSVKSLKVLTLDGMNLDEEGADSLNAIPNLTALFLNAGSGDKGERKANIGRKALARIVAHPSLRTLVLANYQGPHTWIEKAIMNPSLKSINLAFCMPGAQDIERLGMSQNLEAVSINDRKSSIDPRRLGDSDLKNLCAIKNLRDLSLPGAGVTDQGLRELARVKRLRSLMLMDCKIGDEGTKELAGLTHLEKLHLGDTLLTDVGVAHLSALKELRWLSIAMGKDSGELKLNGMDRITDRGIGALKNLAKLEHLDLAWTGLTDEGGKAIATLPALQWLDMDMTYIKGAFLNDMIAGPTLHHLNLSHTKIGEKELRALGRMKALKYLGLSGLSKLPPSSFDVVFELPILESLKVDSTTVNSEWVLRLANLKNLRSVSWRGTKLGPQDRLRLEKALPDLQVNDRPLKGK